MSGIVIFPFVSLFVQGLILALGRMLIEMPPRYTSRFFSLSPLDTIRISSLFYYASLLFFSFSLHSLLLVSPFNLLSLLASFLPSHLQVSHNNSSSYVLSLSLYSEESSSFSPVLQVDLQSQIILFSLRYFFPSSNPLELKDFPSSNYIE